MQSAFRHALIQTVNTSGSLFAQPFDTRNQFRVTIKNHVGQITTIVQNHIQWVLLSTKMQSLFDTPIKFLFVLTFPSINRNTRSSNCSSSVILRRENVT